MNKILLAICAGTILLSSLSSCRSDEIIDTPNIDLSFSLDTLRFDTVFTEVGTVTRFIKIYNNEIDAVVIDDIAIKKGNQSFFRMNVDGIAGENIKEVRIEGQDSIYVFIEASIDPDLPVSVSPYIIEDQLLIQINESAYEVHIEAWGQNAVYYPNRFSASTVNIPACTGSIVWNDPKPYVIYGVLAIDECDLIIEAGTKVYFHGGIAINENGIYNDGLLVITPSASLIVNGTVDDPVYFLSDRLEEDFQDVSGQWGGIIMQAGSRNNKINHAIIKHSIVGVSVDSSGFLDLTNTEIAFTSGSGLVGSHAVIKAENCLFHSNGNSGISLNYGGAYNFAHCTVANYDNQASGLSANNLRCTDPLCQGPIFVYPLNAKFSNCIFVGNEADEISLLDASDGEADFFQYELENCIVLIDELLEPDAFPNFFDNCKDCLNITRQDSLFEDIIEYDFHLDTLSQAIDFGIYLPGLDLDLDGNQREINAVDAGCYEFQK